MNNSRIWYTRVPNLGWSHYRTLLSVANEDARCWYIQEAADSAWSTRQMDRQTSTLYYERILASRDKETVLTQRKKSAKGGAEDFEKKKPFYLVNSFFCCTFAEKKKEKEYEEDICFDGGDTDGVRYNDGKGTEDAGGDDHTSGAKCGGANEGEGPVALDARCEEGGGRFCGKAGDGDLRC